jgi:hypothetical protein
MKNLGGHNTPVLVKLIGEIKNNSTYKKICIVLSGSVLEASSI